MYESRLSVRGPFVWHTIGSKQAGVDEPFVELLAEILSCNGLAYVWDESPGADHALNAG